MTKRKKLTPIQASANGEECTFHLEGCLPTTDTTVLCHDTRYVPNSPRKHDLRAAYGCMNCHDILDRRKPSSITEPGNGFELGYEWGRAIARTHVKLMEKGLLLMAQGKPKKTVQISKQLPRREQK